MMSVQPPLIHDFRDLVQLLKEEGYILHNSTGGVILSPNAKQYKALERIRLPLHREVALKAVQRILD